MKAARTPQTSYDHTPALGKTARRRISPYIVVGVAILLLLPLPALLPDTTRTLLYGLGVLFGVTYQRSRVCFVSAVRDPIAFGQTRSARATLIMIAVGSLSVLLIHQLPMHGPELGNVYPLGAHTIVGAFLFGIGMVVAGSCVCGAVSHSGQGIVTGLLVLAGTYVGFQLALHQIPWVNNSRLSGVTINLSSDLGVTGMLLHFGALFLLYIWMLRLERGQ